MTRPEPPLRPREDREGLRTRYLKLKSALFDRATGLPAFPVLFGELHAWLDRRDVIGVVHVEVGDLELVESIYGWQVFDRVVGSVATRLLDAVDHVFPSGTRLALNGVAGDRFVAFIPQQPDGADVDPAFLGRLADAVAAMLERTLDDEPLVGLTPRLSFRAGSAVLAENPFFRFERCVYAAVEQSRATVRRRKRRREHAWSDELHRIIRRRSVEAVFQPVVDLRCREVLGLEAFVRGPRDTLFEAPRTLFELSSRLGVAVELDRMCCETVLRAFAGLARAGKVFVNVLPAGLDDERWRHGDFLPLLESLGLGAGEVVLELSERAADRHDVRFHDVLAGVRADGFGLAIDDVGTGRSDAATLERIRPDFIKLDLSLVRRIDENPIQQEVLSALSRLAAGIDAAVIAEGVESESEAATLVRCGARYAQGYLFAGPSSDGRPGEGGR